MFHFPPRVDRKAGGSLSRAYLYSDVVAKDKSDQRFSAA